MLASNYKRVPLMMTKAELKAVDDWAFERRTRRGEALRQLIALGLKASKSAGTE